MNIEIERCDHSLLSQLFLVISGMMFSYSSSEFDLLVKMPRHEAVTIELA